MFGPICQEAGELTAEFAVKEHDCYKPWGFIARIKFFFYSLFGVKHGKV
jgi:hypothetical protein